MSKNLGGSSSKPGRHKSSVNITSATEHHLSRLLSMIGRFAEYEEFDHLKTVTSENLREALFGSKPSAVGLLAFHDGEYAGFAMFHSTYCGVRGRAGLILSSLYVEPEFRNEGVGTALLRQIAEIACERGYYRAEWSVRNWNDSAIGFFRAFGAEDPKDWKHLQLDEDALSSLAKRHARCVANTTPERQIWAEEVGRKEGGCDDEGNKQIRITA